MALRLRPNPWGADRQDYPYVMVCAGDPAFISMRQFTRLVWRTVRYYDQEPSERGQRNAAMKNARKRTALNGGIAPISTHGTVTGYRYWGCGCEDCFNAAAYACKKQRLERHTATARNGGIAPLPPERHGKASTANNWGCQCRGCREALRTDYQQRKEQG